MVVERESENALQEDRIEKRSTICLASSQAESWGVRGRPIVKGLGAGTTQEEK